MFGHVLVELSIKNIDQVFTYRIPDAFMDQAVVGKRVLVPFGHQTLEGFLMAIESAVETDYELKDIISFVDTEPVLNDDLIQLGKYVSKSTLSHLITAYQAMLPSALKAKSGKKDLIRMTTFYELVPDQSLIDSVMSGRSNKRKELITYMSRGRVSREELKEQFSTSIIKSLVDQGVLKTKLVEAYRLNYEGISRDQKKALSEMQNDALNELLDGLETTKTYLLHGVTGSGKTEVYLQLIDAVIARGKQAIVLVPEISLTPQMVHRFVSRFGTRVALLHSGLNQAEKYDEWRKVNRGEVDIVVGARSAIFAPFTSLGVIIIDEGHEMTYKQDTHPRYDARDVAMFRGRQHGCPVVLGSATPSIETYALAKAEKYHLVTMSERINRQPLPYIHLVDLSLEKEKGQVKIVSSRLESMIRDRLERGEQTILLLNRRGYVPTLTCADCGEPIKCPNCDITLTYHKSSQKLICHYCNHQTTKHHVCSCGSKDFIQLGYGTERVEETLKTMFDARIARMDADTTRNKGSHQKILDAFGRKEYDILLGTQMIAKGLDFPDVTLVGVINADTSIHIPDYRSAELTFQLLSQVSGRAGRHVRPGEVVIQSMNTDHYSLLFAKIHDFEGFYQHELELRKKTNYPPFYRLIKITVSSRDYKQASHEISLVTKFIRNNLQGDVKVLGPTPANILKVNNVYRFGCIIKYKRSDLVYPVLKELMEQYRMNRQVNVDVDINPSRML